ncbi:MAG: hypothetical protein ACHREM_33645, partial [Polyangiales bacterium]
MSRSIAFAAVLTLAACNEEKSKAVAMAENAAASASASAKAKSAASAEVDPKELRFREVTKSLTERTTAYLVAMQKLYDNKSPERRTALTTFFPKGEAGEKEAKVFVDEVEFAGTQGMTLRAFEVTDATPAATLDGGTIHVTQTEVNRGKTRCVSYKVVWKEEAGTLVRQPIDPKT